MMIKYKWFDLQDQNNMHTGTLEDAKKWLQRFWSLNPDDDEDMSEKELEEHLDNISKADYLTLSDMMEGIEWHLETL